VISFYENCCFGITLKGIEAFDPILLVGREQVGERKTGKTRRAEKDRYHEFIELAADGILLGTRDGIILEANSRMCEMAGVPEKELVGKKISEVLFSPETLKGNPFRFDLLYEGKTVVRERTIVRPDGTELVIEMRTRMMPDGTLLSIHRDMTARKVNEEKLRESEAKYRSLFEAMAQGVVYIDRSRTILSVNPAAERILGVPKERLIGRRMSDPEWRAVREDGTRVLEKDRPSVVSLRTGLPNHAVMGIVIGGGEIGPWLSVHAVPLFRPGETRPHQVFVTFEDVTMMKAADAARERALKEKDVLMRELQHRVKNSLQLVQSMLSLEAGRTEPSQSKEVLLAARSRVHSMALFFERLYKSPELGTVELNLYLKDFLDSLNSLYELDKGKIGIVGTFDDVKLDLKRTVPVCLILNELVVNSIKHAYPKEAGGPIHVSLRKSAGNSVILSVFDNGRGFPPGFDRMSASGIGLLLVHMLSEQIGGDLLLGKSLEGGAAVQVQFPAMS